MMGECSHIPINASAVALKISLIGVTLPMILGWFPIPLALQQSSEPFARFSFSIVAIGCLVSLIGILWPLFRGRKWKDRKIEAILDGTVIEQFGLWIIIAGLLLVAGPIVFHLPMGWFSFSVTLGLAVAFFVQWNIIRRWRTRLRKLATNGSRNP